VSKLVQTQTYPPDFEELKKGVKSLLGFNTDQYKNTYLGRRFNARLRAYNLNSYHEYWKLLKNNTSEQERLLNDLTINVTEFFRDRSVYQFLQRDLIPNISHQRNRIRVWSAGSSDGKEAYSIAMLFLELLGEREAASKVSIIATDIDQACLQRARAGTYFSRKGITQTDVSKQLSFLSKPDLFFDISEDNYQIKPIVKKMVSFQYHDLISGPKKHNFDIIFCRNVVIYFSRSLQEVLYMDFYNALNSGGFFVMGKTETLVGDARTKFRPYNSLERIFQKP
jgi:chemotaxis protein methyltransferase CheR